MTGEKEEELAAACLLLAARFPSASPVLEQLAQLHIEMAARLGSTGGRAIAPDWMTAFSAETAFAWLRDRELELARRYGGDFEAWDRYRAAERLVALYEFGELATG